MDDFKKARKEALEKRRKLSEYLEDFINKYLGLPISESPEIANVLFKKALIAQLSLINLNLDDIDQRLCDISYEVGGI